jgi:hypothetical protein
MGMRKVAEFLCCDQCGSASSHADFEKTHRCCGRKAQDACPARATGECGKPSPYAAVEACRGWKGKNGACPLRGELGPDGLAPMAGRKPGRQLAFAGTHAKAERAARIHRDSQQAYEAQVALRNEWWRRNQSLTRAAMAPVVRMHHDILGDVPERLYSVKHARWVRYDEAAFMEV